MPDLIPIGRFSRMARLSVKALRFYDDQGLLPPAWVDPSSGYRFYTAGQAARAEAIRVLRAVDMPVAAIRALLSSGDLAKGLADHRELLRERVAEQERMLRFLERLIDRGGIMPYDVGVKQVPAQTVASLTLTTDLASIGAEMGQGFGTLVSALGAAGSAPAGAPFVIYHDVIDEQTSGRISICIPVAGPVPGVAAPVSVAEVPAGEVAFVTHRGPYPEISPAYHVVTGWIEENGRVAAGAPREVYLNDPQSVAPEELLTEVQFPISS
ncbi:MerR family transcriptional regulator [Actinoplanes sp. OR16]|uniref:MerR family transcriptional regulator n=1 Tax=Actinoplanes sp. OR16 TaxID=946334 RepID=UPI000F702696|nr:MerR family transcriptional regulator [Actinoplanes sp. OR16]BBH70367.1 MerR family transcriptional regulator [Actinoplanes sp. OR16]